MNIGGICTRHVVSVGEDQTLRDAASTMREHHVGALLVVTESDPPEAVGIVTDRDLVVQAMANGIGPEQATLAELTRTRLFTIDTSACIDDALQEMQREGVRRLLVTGEEGRVLGMLSLDDLLEALAGEFVSVAATVRSGIDRESERVAAEEETPAAAAVRVPIL